MRLVLVLLLGAATAACRPEPPLSLDDAAGVLIAARRVGPDSMTRLMDHDDAFGERVLDGISSGDSIWLEVAVALRPSGTADVDEALPSSLAEALPRAPERVLRILGRMYPATEVCSMPFNEPSDSLLRAYYAEARPALLHVQAPELQTIRTACLASLDAAHH